MKNRSSNLSRTVEDMGGGGDSDVGSWWTLFAVRQKTLHLEYIQHVTDIVIGSIGAMHDTSGLVLRHTAVTGAFLKELVAPRLRFLDLGETPVGDDALAYVTKFDKREGLFLDQTEVTDNGVAHLAKLGCLKWLALDNTAVTSDGIEKLYSVESLEYLRLQSCPISPISDVESALIRSRLPGVRVVANGRNS